MGKLKTIKRGQVLANAGKHGPMWCVAEGAFRLERLSHHGFECALSRRDLPVLREIAAILDTILKPCAVTQRFLACSCA